MSSTYTTVRKLATVSPQVNSAARMARCVISTDDVDRQNEVLLPGGINFTDYALNPVCLWDHGMGGATFPIGKAQRPDGTLAIEVGKHEVIGECYFGRTREADELFGLIKDGIVKAASIHVQPYKKAKGPAGESIITECSMLEFSFGAIGVNKNARVVSAKSQGATEAQRLALVENQCRQAKEKLASIAESRAIRRVESKLPILARLIDRLRGKW